MNMPKRASCHHFMRRARSASAADAELVWAASVCGNRALAAMGATAVAASADAVPFNHVRRVILLSDILVSVDDVSCRIALVLCPRGAPRFLPKRAFRKT